MDEWILDVIRTAGYAGIALLMILENVVPAIPSELILPFAGYLGARDQLQLAGVIASASAGSAVGATVWYVVGRRWGEDGVHRFVERHGRWLLIDADDLTRTNAWFRRHQKMATLVGRLMPGIRSLISVPAGVTQMSFPAFLAYTVIGTVGWTTALTVAGYLLADAYERAQEVVGPVGTLLFAAVVVFLAVRAMRRRRMV